METELLAQTVEAVSVSASGARYKKPIEIPRPAWWRRAAGGGDPVARREAAAQQFADGAQTGDDPAYRRLIGRFAETANPRRSRR